jgi:hypothetical protein
MLENSGQIQPSESYAELMQMESRKAAFLAQATRKSGIGGILTLISSPQDTQEQTHFVNINRDHSGVEQTDVENIDIEKVLNALELGINRFKLEIPDKTLEGQSIPENVFQYVYRHFGKNNQGWRLGRTAALDYMKKLLENQNSDLEDSPFADFLRTLDLDLGRDQQAPRLVVLQYPQLDTKSPIRRKSDVDEIYKEPNQAERIDKFLHIYSIVNQVYPGLFKKDNLQGNLVLNVIDPSYRYFAARDPRWLNAYEKMCWNYIQTPTAQFRDEQILEAGH